jgi:hypothetical protein
MSTIMSPLSRDRRRAAVEEPQRRPTLPLHDFESRC